VPLEHTILDVSKLQYYFSLERLAGLMPPARQAPAPLKVYFYAGEDGMEAGEGGDWNKALNNPLRRLMFHNVACPMLNMFGPGDCRRFDHPFMIPNLEITFQPNIDIECLGYRLQDLVWIT
jgi:hypothetical protein